MQRGDQWYSISADPLWDDDGNLKNAVHIMSDISKEKEIDKMKSELISNVSHELRTPLSIIKEGICLVSDGSLGQLDEAQRDVLSRVKNNIVRLTLLINDLLDISQIEAGRMVLKKSLANIVALVVEVFSSLQNQAKGKHIELSSGMSNNIQPLYIDRDRIFQVLANLVINGIKFTPEHGSITIKISDRGKEIEVSVADTGVGISPQNIPSLFDRFSQFNRVYGPGDRGNGLGLAISKDIVEMHGGSIWVESTIRKGSVFTFSLP
jgi:signal transduction histidine kinase